MSIMIYEYYDDIWFYEMDRKIFFFKHKVHNWLKEREISRKSDQVSRCSSKSSSKPSLKFSAKSSFSSISKSSAKAKVTEEKVNLMMEATCIWNRRDAEYQTRSFMV